MFAHNINWIPKEEGMESGVLWIVGAVGSFALFIFLKLQRSSTNSSVSSLPGVVDWAFGALALVLLTVGAWHKIFFYAEPGIIYHVRMITGQESVVADQVGYKMYLFGYITKWKKAITVQANTGGDAGTTVNANLKPQDIIFVDQVPAKLSATVRFSMPTDRNKFLELAHMFRTQENLLRTTLVPAFKETCRQTGNLMSAEDYYLGARSRFVAEFRNQMEEGVYTDVKRVMQIVDELGRVHSSTVSVPGVTASPEGLRDDNKKTVYVVRINKGTDGKLKRKIHDFVKFGITVLSAVVTDMVPDPLFQERMKNKMQASSERAIAKEQRIKEEEQKKTVEAKGAREIAERKAQMKVDQIEKTTLADTAKQLAIIKANQLKERAEIDRQAAAIKLEQAKLDAQAERVAADARAYAKKAVMTADGALEKKLATYERVQQAWSDAYARRQVPAYWFGGGNSKSEPGRDNDLANFMKTQTLKNLRELSLDTSIQGGPSEE